jgi:hypothetical protein
LSVATIPFEHGPGTIETLTCVVDFRSLLAPMQRPNQI